MAHRERRVAQRVLDGGAIDAALDARGLAHRIDLQDLVHVAHRDGHDLVEAGGGLDALHHRRAAAVGNRLGADAVAPVEDRHHVLLGLREGHGVGRVGHGAHEHARGIEPGLAVAVFQPRQVIGAHHRLQRRRHVDARLSQGNFLGLGRRRHVEAGEAVALGDLGLPGLDLLRRQIFVGVSPGIEFLLPPHGSLRLVFLLLQAAKAAGLWLPLICVRCMMRRASPSNGSRRCMVERLSHITRSPSFQTCS